MTARPVRRLVLAVAAIALAATSSVAHAEPTRITDDGDCAHPHPCGYRWHGPAGPFPVDGRERVEVESDDGVVLNGWLWRPVVPGDVPVPVILISTPYLPTGSAPATYGSLGGVPVEAAGGVDGFDFVAAGYAVALFSVRGTGDSGGCFEFKSSAEQRDQAVIVDWLGDQPWSNGRVAMIGLSYPGTTPVMAAIQNPPALKTIVIAGTILDEYGFLHTPQGAQFFEASGVGPVFTADESLVPAASAGSSRTPERACPAVVDVNTVVPVGEVAGERDPRYWADRRFIDGVPDITAATFVVHGFQDRYGSGHAFQDDWAWETLTSAPKRMLLGQWHHEWPNRNTIRPEWSIGDWADRLLAWFDYWLKGWGSKAPGIGTVEFQDSAGTWHDSRAWPPPRTGAGRRHDEVVYLAEGAAQPAAAEERASFLSAPPPWRGGTNPNFNDRVGWRWTSPCSDPLRLAYVSEPVAERTVLAGNAFAWLNLESSQPGGLIEVQLYDVAPEFNCDEQLSMEGARPLTEGAADLQYHSSVDYRAHPFPVATPTHVRVDLPNLADVLEPGHRLGVVLSHGVYYRWTSREGFPTLTVVGDGSAASSHLVLPVVSGGFGGQEPVIDYLSRPFLPN